MLCQSFADDGSFIRGVAAYKAQNFSKAAHLLDAVCEQSQAPPDAFYYAALAHEKLGDYQRALVYYQTVISRYPVSRAAILAQVAIARQDFRHSFDPFLIRTQSALDSQPRETYVEYEERNGAILVDGAINDQPIKMIFDTGAATSCCSLHHLEQLGIEPPTGQPDVSIGGIGSQRTVPGWRMFVDYRVGRIARHRFPIFVSAVDLPYPLVGPTFFENFQYTIDKNTHTISFKRSDKSKIASSSTGKSMVVVNSSSKYEYQVPFTMDGQALIVVAKVNGRNCPVQFDTGASLCMFSRHQLDAIGGGRNTRQHLQITGAAGTTDAPIFEISNVALGPISKPLIVAVSDQARIKYPLLGQNFFRDTQYTIDYAHHVIKFEN
jgi:predicted aspartyl protease